MNTLTPEHAKELVTNFDVLPEEEKPKAAQLLKEYAAKRAEQGLGAFQTPPGVSRDRRAHFEALYADSAGLVNALPEGERKSFEDAAANSLNPEEAKLRAVNQAWFAENNPDVGEVAFKNWPAYRKAWAKEHFGVDKPEVGEKELFTLIGQRMTEDKQRDQFLGDAFASLSLEASKGGSFVEAWRKVGQGMAGKPGWSPEAHDKYREAGLRLFNQANEAIGPIRPAIDLGRAYYALAAQGEVQKDGQSNLGEIQAARSAFVDALMRLDTKQREQALGFAIAGAAEDAPKRMGEGGDASGAEKAAVSLERAIAGFGGNVVRVAKLTGDALKRYEQRLGSRKGGSGLDYERTEAERMVDSGLVDSVDPIKSKSRIVQGVYDAIDSLPYMATAIVPYAGIPLTLAAMAEDNRQKFIADGVGKDEALGLGLLAAAPQVAVERLQANLVFKGKMPGFERWLAKPVTTKLELARKVAVVSGLSVATENAEEFLQDATPYVVQEVASMLTESVPDANGTKEWNDVLAPWSKGRVDTFFALLPLALVGAGTATFKEASYGRAYLSDMKILKAAGFSEESAQRIATAETVQEKETLLQDEWAKMREAAKVESDAAAADVGGMAQANAQAQADAFAELDADMMASFQEQAGPVVGASAVMQEDGSYAVLDKNGELVDVAFSSEAALALVDEVNKADDLDMSQAIQDMVDYFNPTNEPGQSIEIVGESRSLRDKVNAGEITEDEAQRAVDVAIAMGKLDAGASIDSVSIEGENIARFNARTGLFEDVSRIYEGANPLVVVEERAEGYLKRRIQDGSLDWKQVQAWREAVEGTQRDNSSDSLTEWFSQSAKAWMVGESENLNEGIPASFRAFLRAMKEYFAQVLGLAKKLRELDAAGQLDEGYKMHLARAVGLDRSHLDAIEREQAKRQAGPERGQYSAREALLEIGLPKPGKTGGELQSLYESLNFGQRVRLFKGTKGLDAVAELLRVDYGFQGINTENDVRDLAERVFLRGEEAMSSVESADSTFSLAPAGDGKLIAVHNTSAEGLRYAAKLGGFPVPSVGVVKRGDLFHGFGEITLIVPPALVNPANEPVFSADAYSPRFSRAEYREVKVKDAEKVLKPVRKYFERFEELGDYGQIWDYMVNDAKPEEAIRIASRSLSMKAAFLAESGVEVQPVMKAKYLRVEAVAQPSFQQWLKDGGDYRPDYEDTAGRKRLTEAFTRAYAESIAGYEKDTQEKLMEAFREQMIDPEDGLLLFGRTLPIEQSIEAVGKEEVDSNATGDALNKALEGKEREFSAWVESRILPQYGEPFIKSGRKKLPVTLENLTEQMKGLVRNQEKSMTFGEGATMAALSRQFSSVEEMKNSAWQLASEDKVSAERDAAKKLASDYREAVAPYFTGRDWKGNVDTWAALDASMRALTHLKKLGSNERAMARALRKEGFGEVPAEVLKMGVEAYLAMLNVPVPYFEAKPQRAVRIGDMVGAVIPSDTPADVRAILEKQGVKVVEYSRGENEKQAREQAVASFTEATFALADKGRSEEMAKKLRERRVSQRIANAEHEGKAFSPELQSRMAGRMYEVVPLKVTVDEALKVVASKSVAEVASLVTADTAEVPRSVQVALGVALIEHFDAQGNYAEAQRIAERVAELGTELGRAVNAFKLLGKVLDTPAKAMVFFKRQVAVAEKAIRERQPAAEAAQAAVGDVQKQAFKLFKKWVDEINGVSRLSENRVPVRVEDLPEVTFALSAEVKASGIVSVVARMLRESGADATEAALLERYGPAVENALPDLFIEAQKLNTKRGSGRKAQKKGGKAARSDSKAGEGGKGAPAGQDASTGQETPNLTDAQIEATLAETRGKAESQSNLEGLEGFTEVLVNKVVEQVRVKGLDTPEQVRDAVRNLFKVHGINATPETVAEVFKRKFSLPKMTDAQAERVSQLAQNIASTPDNSAERTDATIALVDYVNAQLREVDAVEKAWAVWYANVLSGYNTHARNLWANFLSLGTELPLAAVKVNPMETILNLRELFYGVPAGVKLGISEGVRQVKTGQTSILRAGENKFRASDALEKAPFKGGNANPYNWLKVVKRLLTAEDLFAFGTAQETKARMVAWEMAKSSGLEGEALANEIERLLNNTEEQLADFEKRAELEWDKLTDELKATRNREDWIARRVEELRISERNAELIERSSGFAARATFNHRPEGSLGVIAGVLMDGLGKVGRMEANSNQELVLKAVASSPKLVFPFIRIATNVLNRGIDYTPYGMIRSLRTRKTVYLPGTGPQFETKTADEREMELKRGILGVITMGLLSALASPDDDEAPIQIHGAGSGDRAKNQALNGPTWMPYSIEFRGKDGSRFVTFQYSPLAVGLAILGNWHDARRYKRFNEEEANERLAAALTGAGSVILDQSFMASAADLLRLMGDSGSVSEKALYSFLGRTFNPATAIPFSNLVSNVERDFDDKKRDATSIKAALMANVPVVRRWNKPALDVLGDEMENRPLDWFTRAEQGGTPEARIYRMFAAKNVHPSNIWTYKGEMEPEQFYQFTKARGQFIKDTLTASGGALIETMMSLDDEQAKEVMSDISKDATAYAKAQVGYIPKPKTKK